MLINKCDKLTDIWKQFSLKRVRSLMTISGGL